ncbi:MAG: hypothetical protein ACRD3H_08875 [Terriglobales bacterium]
MKVLATLLLSVSLHGSYLLPPAKMPVDKAVAQQQRPARKGGRWYFAENGHAVYCYGPVRLLPQPEGGLQRVATFCQGDKNMVPLKD